MTGTVVNEIVYMILDELKISSNDSYYTKEHILYLLDKWRAFILKQRYSDIKRIIPEENYQTFIIPLVETDSVDIACMSTTYMRSIDTVPAILPIGNTKITSIDYFKGEFNLVSKERLRYVGHNKYLKDMIYCAIDPDMYIYFRAMNPQVKYLDKIKLTAIFSSFIETTKYHKGDIYELPYPIEGALIPIIIELVVKELSTSIYRLEDTINNSADDFGAPQNKQSFQNEQDR